MPQKKYRAGAFKATANELADLKISITPSGLEPNLLLVTGKCPRCKHDVHKEIPQRVFDVTGDGTTASAQVGTTKATESITVGERVIIDAIRDYLERHPAPLEHELVLECNCGVTHADGKVGCGAVWSTHLEWDEGATQPVEATLGPGIPVTAREIEEERQRDALGRTELSRLRAAAGNWRTGLGALLVLLPTLVVVKGNDAVKDLSNGYKILIGVLTALGSIAAIWAAVLALRAAFGPLASQGWRADMEALRRDETDTTLSDLKWTRKLTLAALVLLGAAIGVAWAAPSSDPAYLQIVKKDTTVLCGKYGGVGKDLKVKMTDQTVPVPLTEVKSVAFVTSC